MKATKPDPVVRAGKFDLIDTIGLSTIGLYASWIDTLGWTVKVRVSLSSADRASTLRMRRVIDLMNIYGIASPKDGSAEAVGGSNLASTS